MTEQQQKRFYFPAWNRAARANDWTMQKSRMIGGRAQAPQGGAEVAEIYRRVWEAAQVLASGQHRAVRPEDLRHACHIVALGRDKSSSDLTNPEVDRVVTLFRLLADPDDLDAMMVWSHPEIGEAKRYVSSINQMLAAGGHSQEYLARICRSKFRSIYTWPFWEDLPVWALRQLYLTIRGPGRVGADVHPRGICASDCRAELSQKPVNLTKQREMQEALADGHQVLADGHPAEPVENPF